MPLIENRQEVDPRQCEERCRLLSARFPGKVGLLHGALKGPSAKPPWPLLPKGGCRPWSPRR